MENQKQVIKKIEINCGSIKIKSKSGAELTYTYFVEIINQFVEQNSKVYAACKVTKLNTCLETIFILPVPEDEGEKAP